MPTIAEFVVASCQATLFFGPSSSPSSAVLLTKLFPKWSARFDAEPQILGLSLDAPPELPRAILRSRDGEWTCQIAGARVNIFWNRTKDQLEDTAQPSIAEVYATASGLLKEYCEIADPKVGRIAAVINRFVIQEQPARFLAGHFCKERWIAAPFNRPENFELHAHKTYRIGDAFDVNSWVRNKTGELTTEMKPVPIIIVEQDLNTVPDTRSSPRIFSVDEIRSFFEVVIPGFDETLSLYYPS